MRDPTEEELAAIALAFLTLQREPSPPPLSRWRRAARALAPDEPQPPSWRNASRAR